MVLFVAISESPNEAIWLEIALTAGFLTGRSSARPLRRRRPRAVARSRPPPKYQQYHRYPRLWPGGSGASGRRAHGRPCRPPGGRAGHRGRGPGFCRLLQVWHHVGRRVWRRVWRCPAPRPTPQPVSRRGGGAAGLTRFSALSDLMDSGLRLYLFIAPQFPSRQMKPFGSKLL